MSDCYDGQDLLADVFEGTEDAPDPAPVIDCGGSLLKLWANPADPRWSVDMSRRPNGDVIVVRSIRRARSDPDGPESPRTDQPVQGRQPGPENGSAALRAPYSGNQDPTRRNR